MSVVTLVLVDAVDVDRDFDGYTRGQRYCVESNKAMRYVTIIVVLRQTNSYMTQVNSISFVANYKWLAKQASG